MTDILVTADANMLASGFARLLTHPDAAPVQFVQAWLAERFTLVQSQVLLDEFDRALSKRYFALRVSRTVRLGMCQLIERRARLTPLTVTVSGVASHPEDDLVLAAALSGGARFVVTGDHRLLDLKQYQSVILMSVHEFMATLPGLEAGSGD